MTIINVTTASDSGVGSLRNAIASAKAGDTIKFSSNLANKVIKLTSGEISITKNLTIDGSGAANLKISGDGTKRVLNIDRHVDAKVQNLTIADGYTNDAGGGIKVGQYGSLIVENCKFNNNRGGKGGAIFVGYSAKATVINSNFDKNDGTVTKSGHSSGAISTFGSGDLTVRGCEFTNNKGVNGGAIYSLLGGLTVENSVFRNNSSAGDLGGGAICTDGANAVGSGSSVGGVISIRGSRFENNQAQGEGGALLLYGYAKDQILLENSTVVGNTASKNAKGIARGGGLRGNSALTIRNVTFANNTAEKQGGGVWLDGGSEKNIINSTFSGNKTLTGAGGAMLLNSDKSTPVNIINSTIVNNYAGRACGAVWINDPAAPVTLTNSIVANNKAVDLSQQQVGYQLQDGGGNIEFPAPSRGRRVVAGSRIVDPLLGPLQKVGNSLLHPLLAGSPAINSGKTGGIIPTIDATGMARDSKPDVGAFEISSQMKLTAMNISMSGPNLLRGTRGNDTINGSSRSNIIQGGDGHDILTGGSSNDIIQGGEGNDVLRGGKGVDILSGVGGNDRFVYNSVSEGGDKIQYFEAAKDTIDLRKIMSGANFNSSNPYQAYIRKEQVGSHTVVRIDSDGSLSANQFQTLLTLTNFNSSNLTEKNFLL
ncbi:type I secretion C-terminal target domain-containing protein [Calothrix sp. FACHB-1219]|uniref:right-handed parallel beta-helix repeat-containing protein n=1 Tax=unclassified Calothrix TaxID=2619626 RepID=UPI001686A612|nr:MULTISPECIES: right-handed parallel beta-helix repeat-containing protein [unclassified Calothrix]MBD2206128.1 type I secretion C-terminal target domain-containing protein [Calothrix sp. FACHB-168]MBD2220899.1 type I secretion C-terminal target domain-containing protein [Calothrix sp. FACHB-1219]